MYPCSTKTREVLGNLEGGGDGFPNTSRVFGGVRPFSHHQSFYRQGVDQKILPCGQGRIDSVKINPSLLMMREWIIWSRKILSFNSILVVSEYSAINIDSVEINTSLIMMKE